MRIVRFILIMAMTMTVAACGGHGHGHDSLAVDTIYKPAYAAYLVTGDSSGRRMVIPDTAGGYSFATPLYIGSDAPADVISIAHPARRIVCMSSTHVAILSALGMTDRIVGVSGLRFISDEEVLRRNPADVGPAENIDYELLLSLDPDLVLLYGIGAPSPMQTKLDELGIPYIYINEFNEQTPLGKAEWLVAVAEICGAGSAGRDIFHNIASRYDAVRQAAVHGGRRPKVILNTPYNGVWYMPAGNSYMIRMIEDAGGSYVYPNDNTSSVPLDLEQVYMLASQADVWLNIDAAATVGELKRKLPKFADIPAVRSGRLWASNKRQTAAGGNDFYESAIVHPDRVLADFHTIFTGGSSDSTYYYVQLK